MIISNELLNWARSREGQRKTQALIEQSGLEWRRGLIRSRFADALSGLPHEADVVAGSVVSLFEGDDAWLDELVGGLSAAAARDPFFQPPFISMHTDIHTGLLLYENELVSIGLGVSRASQLTAKKAGRSLRRSGVSIAFSGQVAILKFVKSGNALLSFWEVPAITRNFSSAAAGSCRCTGKRRIEDGEILVLDGRYQSYVIEHANSNLILLQAAIKADQAPLAVEYDAGSLDFVGCSASEDTASRIQMTTTLLRKLGHEEAFPVLAAQLDHPNFFVRWHVLRELVGVDAAAARPHLERLAKNDPHPEVRRAAGDVLARMASADNRKAEICPA